MTLLNFYVNIVRLSYNKTIKKEKSRPILVINVYFNRTSDKGKLIFIIIINNICNI